MNWVEDIKNVVKNIIVPNFKFNYVGSFKRFLQKKRGLFGDIDIQQEIPKKYKEEVIEYYKKLKKDIDKYNIIYYYSKDKGYRITYNFVFWLGWRYVKISNTIRFDKQTLQKNKKEFKEEIKKAIKENDYYKILKRLNSKHRNETGRDNPKILKFIDDFTIGLLKNGVESLILKKDLKSKLDEKKVEIMNNKFKNWFGTDKVKDLNKILQEKSKKFIESLYNK